MAGTKRKSKCTGKQMSRCKSPCKWVPNRGCKSPKKGCSTRQKAKTCRSYKKSKCSWDKKKKKCSPKKPKIVKYPNAIVSTLGKFGGNSVVSFKVTTDLIRSNEFQIVVDGRNKNQLKIYYGDAFLNAIPSTRDKDRVANYYTNANPGAVGTALFNRYINTTQADELAAIKQSGNRGERAVYTDLSDSDASDME